MTGHLASAELRTIRLTEIFPDSSRQDWGSLKTDCNVGGKPLRIGDRTFPWGLGTHANSEVVYELPPGCEQFKASVGVDAAVAPLKAGSVVFKVVGDGRQLFASGIMRWDSPAAEVNVSVAGVRQLKLLTTDAGDGITCDHADWAAPVLICRASDKERTKSARIKVKSAGICIWLTDEGEIRRIKSGGVTQIFQGFTALTGCWTEGQIEKRPLPRAGWEFSRQVRDAQGHACRVVERFTPTPDSIRWEIELSVPGEPWTTAIHSWLNCAEPETFRIWAPWSDPEQKPATWRDPLVPAPFCNRTWHYGNSAQIAPIGGDFVAIPLVTFSSSRSDTGFSLVLSPDDVLLNLDLSLSAAGQMRFSRQCHRLGNGKPLRFSMDLVGHEGGWRGGLRWMASHYPAFFDPPNPRVHAMSGCGAYSGDERPIDAVKFKAMSFRINWKLSDDFPYMGMFIPPVRDAGEHWQRSCAEAAPPGKLATISCQQMNDYARQMRGQGFHLLNYFNVTEFGKNMKDKEVSPEQANDPALWKDPVAFLKLKLPRAYFKQQPPDMYYGAWLVDAGDPAYQNFLLEQARRHIELLPDTDGICIDRMDWLRWFNPDADDGVSWVNDKPARSLYLSWQSLMTRLGPLMHQADKVIFGNPMTMRLELNRELDGIYTEHGDNPGALNAASLMGIRKPVLAWTCNETLDQPNPDSFFQRNLYLGVYPTAPYPFNHHCITPSKRADRYYLDYGPLMDAMRGRKWVLQPHCVEASAPGAKVNLFAVPNGYVAPVTFGETNTAVTLTLRNLDHLSEPLRGQALHPGSDTPVALKITRKRRQWTVEVPLKRGCAMVQFSGN